MHIDRERRELCQNTAGYTVGLELVFSRLRAINGGRCMGWIEADLSDMPFLINSMG